MTLKRPAFQWYPKDYLTDLNVVGMTLEEEGAYRRLIDYCWLNGSIPADGRRMAPLCKCGPEKMAELWPSIAPCFRTHPTDPKLLIHPRLEKELEKQDRYREMKSEAGRAGARARWSAARGDPPDASATILPLAKNGSPSPSPFSTTEKPPPPPRKPAGELGVYDELFGRFWAAYPRGKNENKRAAHRAWLARVREGTDPEKMIKGAERYATFIRSSGQYAKNASTFVGPDRHWETPWVVTEAVLVGKEQAEPQLPESFRKPFIPDIRERQPAGDPEAAADIMARILQKARPPEPTKERSEG